MKLLDGRKNSNKWILWAIGAVVLIAVIVSICLFVINNHGGDDTQDDESTFVDGDVVEDDAEQSGEAVSGTEGEIQEKEEVIQYDGEDPNNASEITGVLTHAEVTGDELVLRVNIDQYLSGGSCRLSIKQDGQELYGEEAAIIGLASTATCEGFNVAMDRLRSGDLDILIEVSADEKTGVIKGGVTL